MESIDMATVFVVVLHMQQCTQSKLIFERVFQKCSPCMLAIFFSKGVGMRVPVGLVKVPAPQGDPGENQGKQNISYLKGRN
jgi:hypothetical protein